MNPRVVAALQAGMRAVPLALAFLLPACIHLRFFEPERLKDLLAAAAAVAAAALLSLRWLESGRVEAPARALPLAGAAALWLALLVLGLPRGGPGFLGGLVLAAGPTLFLAVLLEASSVSFAAALADATLAAALPMSVWGLLELAASREPSAALGRPEALGVFLGAAFPLAIARLQDPEAGRSRRALAWTSSLLLPCGAAASGAPAGMLAAAVAAAAFSGLTLARSRSSSARGWALAALWCLPALAAALSAAGPTPLEERLLASLRPDSGLPRRIAADFGPAGLAACLGALLGAMTCSAAGALRRLQDGDERAGALAAALTAAAAGLLAAGCFGAALSSAALGTLAWILLAAGAGLALERGPAAVCALPLPLGPGPRRALSTCAAVLAAWALSWPARLGLADVELNRGEALLLRGSLEAAAAPLSSVPRWHPDAWLARKLSAEALTPGGRVPSDAPTQATLLALYREMGELGAGAEAGCGAAAVHRARGAWREAASSLEACPRPGVKGELAELYLLLGSKESALAAARDWTLAEPGNPEAWRALSEHYRGLGRRAVARRMLERAAKVHELARAGAGTESTN